LTGFELTTRPVEPADRDFLVRVYGSTRADELAPLPWDDEQKLAFVIQQFTAQDADYRQRYPAAEFLVIERDGVPIGRMYTTRLDDGELRLIDLALLREHRGAGIGSTLLGALLDEADREGLMVSLHVEHWNPAIVLYERLGFRRAGSNEVYVRMERPRPST
jgi:ribosomal protein S18 acetylase RimI-like enzyme